MRIYDDELELERYLKKYHVDRMFDDIEKYRKYFHMIKINKGDCLYSGDPMNHIYFMVDGKLKICANLSNGKRLLLYFYSKFEILGDLEFLKIQNDSVTIEAVRPTTCIALDVRRIRDQMMDDKAFLKAMLYEVGIKLSKSSSNSAITALYPLENRLCSYISAVSVEISQSGRRVFSEKMTETAELLGTSYRHLTRVMKELCDSRLMLRTGRFYEVLDEKRLQELSGDLYI